MIAPPWVFASWAEAASWLLGWLAACALSALATYAGLWYVGAAVLAASTYAVWRRFHIRVECLRILRRIRAAETVEAPAAPATEERVMPQATEVATIYAQCEICEDRYEYQSDDKDGFQRAIGVMTAHIFRAHRMQLSADFLNQILVDFSTHEDPPR